MKINQDPIRQIYIKNKNKNFLNILKESIYNFTQNPYSF